MKKLITILTLALIAAGPLTGRAEGSIESDPAYLPIDKALDLKAIPPQVNVNLPRFLLKDAISGLTNKALPGGIDLADLVKDVKLIRVVVIDATKTNRAELDKGMKALRSQLDSKWTSIVNVPENNVGIYAMGDPSGESMAGVAVLVNDHGQAVIVNIVGHVSIGKLITLAAQSHRIPEDLLSQLQGVSGQSVPPPAKKIDTTATNPPAGDPGAKSQDTVTK